MGPVGWPYWRALLVGPMGWPDWRNLWEALGLMERILGGGLGGVLAEPVGPATGEVDLLATALMEHHLERRLRSVAVLDQTQR